MPAKAASLVIQIEDVSRLDTPSPVICEERQVDVTLEPGGHLAFELHAHADLVDPRNDYSVRVHIDINGSGQVERGDLITMQSYPVLTHGYGNDVRLEVRPV